MIVVRDIFQAKYGRGNELVALFEEARRTWAEPYATRVLTDATGPFFTVVVESVLPSLAEWERVRDSLFARPDFAAWFERSLPLVESGRRELYTLVAGT